MITLEDIKYLEGLVKIKVDESELPAYQKEVSDIVDYIQEIQTLELGDYAGEESHQNIFRSDVENNDSMHIERAIKNAPESVGNLYKVSQVIKQ